MKKRLLSAVVALCMLFGTAAVLPESVIGDSIGITASAEYYDGDYVYEDTTGGVVLKGYYGDATSLQIPSSYRGKPVVIIGSSAFFLLWSNDTLTYIKVPSTVKTVEQSGFYSCENLLEVEFEEGVEVIKKYAFAGCPSLTTVNIPSTVTSLHNEAFESNKESERCKALQSITVSANNAAYAEYDGAVYNKAKTELICFPIGKTSIEIPGTVTTIPERSFSKTGTNALKTAKLNEGTTTIEKWAFINCTEMKSIVIPRSVTSIGKCGVGYYHYKGEPTDPDQKIADFVIYGYKGTVAETYAKDNGFTFEEIKECEHTYATPSWTWSGYTSASAKFTCTKCSKQQVVTANITSAVTDPSCTEAGKTTYTATAEIGGKSYTNQKVVSGEPALGHNYTHETVAPTCEQQGYTEHSCTRCDYSYRDNLKSALGHDLAETVVEPTCEAGGYTLHKCKRAGCNYSYETDYTEKTEHKWGAWTKTVDATCLTGGEETRTCSVCKKKDTRTTSALGHDYIGTVTNPTCTEQGYTTYKCSRCESTYKGDYTDAYGHKWGSWQEKKAATCTETGSEQRTCSVCKEKETREIKKLGHNYKNTVVAPTCTEQGYTLHECTRCDDFYKDTYTDATGHSWSKWKVTTPVTCERDGVESRSCSVCHEMENRTIKTSGHNYKATVVAPSCTERGYTVHTCENCSSSYKDTYTDATGHKWGDWEVTKQAICLEAGLLSRKCTVCGIIETQPVEKLGHNYKATVYDPTCTEQGYTLHQCTRCDDFYKDSYTDAKGHSFGKWKTVTAATCTEAGLQKRECSSCHITETQDITPEGHSYTSQKVAATCTEKGYTVYTCSKCSNSYTDNYTTELGHNWGSWTTIKAATCTEDGEQKRTCSRCKQYETKALTKTGHSYKTTVVAPSCTEKGYTVYSCTKCDYSYNDDFKDALGHSMGQWKTTKAATCTEDGTKTRSCTRTGCTHSESDVITKLGHNYKSVVTAPTCTEYGYTTHTCSRCKDSYTDTRTDPKGHNWGSWTTTKTATCTEDGSRTRKCTRTGCTASETETLEKLGHNYRSTVTAPSCTEQGYTTHNCTRCTASYKDTYTEALGHKWGDWITTIIATETREGQMTRTCSECSHTETKVIPKLGHNYVKTVTAPTCTARGYTTYRCSDCGDSYVADYVDALGHSYKVSKTVAPTCTEQGYTVYACQRCNHSYNDNFTDPAGHKWGAWNTSTAATCTLDGVRTRKCSACSKTETETIKATGHDYNETLVNAKCTEQGYTLYSCKNCNHSYKDNYTKALGHSFGSWRTTKAATCLEDGERTRSCTRMGCNETQTETITKLGHDYTAKVVDPTCTEQGYTLYTCSRCGDFYKSNYTDAAGHKFGNWTTTTPATCAADGVQTRTCSVCRHSETKPITKLSHNYKSVIAKPTCTEQGFITYTCSLCGDSYTGNFIDALGHAWGEWVTTLDATCETDGEQTRNCKNCTEKQTKTINKLGHSFTIRTVAPTCTMQGYTDYTCSRCKYNYKDGYKQALGHSFGDWVTVDATIIKEGSKSRKCSSCGESEVLTLPKPSIRLYGNSRYDTAFGIADQLKKERGGQAFDSVIIASGMDFADALSATYLAKDKNAPILITAKTDATMSSVAAYIKANAKQNATIYIIGGTGAVSAEMEKKLNGYNVIRLFGSNRYLTNIAVLKEAGVTTQELLVASGMGYADALSASAVGKPIFLVSGSGLTAEQKNYLATLGSTTATIIGGTGAVSAGVEKELRSRFRTVSRLGGKSRYETSIMVAEKYFNNPPTIAVAYGLNYPDGLCGGPLAMQYGCPLILTVSNDYSAAKAYASKIKATNTVTFGGPTLITDDALNGIIGK